MAEQVWSSARKECCNANWRDECRPQASSQGKMAVNVGERITTVMDISNGVLTVMAVGTFGFFIAVAVVLSPSELPREE